MTFIYTWKLYYPRQKNWASPSWLYHFPELSPQPPPPPPPHTPKKIRIFFRPTLGAREFPSVVSGFHLRTLSKFPGYGEVTHLLAHFNIVALLFPTQSLAEKSLSEDQKNHLTRSRDFCTISSVVCCSFCRDQHVSHTEPFGSVLFLVLLSFTCSW